MRKLSFFTGLIMSVILFSLTVSAQLSTTIQPFLSGLSSPLYITNAKDGTKRLFVVQQGGVIKVVQPGSTTPTDFLDISSKTAAGGELGLLGMAFHPQFSTNHYFFVDYTRAADGATVIARYTAINNNSVGDPNSERILLTIPQPFSNHKGGMVEFRQDNGVYNLYIGMGDGGGANDPNNNAQNINSLLGKFLRITPDVSGNDSNPAYTVPADNPYVGVDGADEIYTIGMRNPFRWSFDRGGTHQLWAADVGQSAREEIDIITKGGNYGWRIMEGTICNPNLNGGVCTPPAGHIPPIFEYGHTAGRCSIIGGYVYRGTRGALPNGAYTFADYCTGEVWLLLNGQQTLIQHTTRNVSSFGEDEDGELYVVGLGGTVDKIIFVNEVCCGVPKTNADFDGDGKTDFSVFRPSNSAWYILNSSNNSFSAQQFGAVGDIPTPEDFDGDGKTDIAVFRPSNGTWYYVRSSNNTFAGFQFGQNGDTPAAADYDGDGKADFAVSRGGSEVSSPRFFYILQSSNGAFRSLQWGTTGTDRPVVGDFDGDGKSDVAVYREAGGYWYVLQSSNNSFQAIQFGAGSYQDIEAPGDYDGDGKTDKAVFRKATGTWYILRSSDGAVQGIQFGANGDIPVVGDYDGDGKDDIAVFRPSNGTWYVLQSSNGGFKAAQFGTSEDLPAPAYDKP